MTNRPIASSLSQCEDICYIGEGSCIDDAYYLLEQLIERGARILGFGDCCGCFALDGLARLEQLTVVAQVLFWDSFGDRLAALKPRAGIKAYTVFARVKVAVTFGALGIHRDAPYVHINECPAQGAPGYFSESWHFGSTHVVSRLSRARLLWLPFFVLVAALFVFSIH
jgi:hypothetical protein